jgi:hypothetical protein
MTGYSSRIVTDKMPIMKTRYLFIGISSLLVFTWAEISMSRSGDRGWTVPYLATPAQTWDSSHLVEGTGATPAWSWHARVSAWYLYGPGLADRASQCRANIGFGLGLPRSFEAMLSLPVGWTFGTHMDNETGSWLQPVEGMGDYGFGVGDLRPTLLWSVADASQGGLGLMFGLSARVPTGDHEKLMGEGGFALEPLVSAAFQVFGSRLSLNLAYLLRPEHIAVVDGERFEQDDDLIWRAAVRIPGKFDVAWSVEAQGAIGMATDEGIWPSSESRPICMGIGVDFPVGRPYRLGLIATIGIAGEAVPSFLSGLSFSWQPVLRDEDKDGVGSISDECPLLSEDPDGFEDEDGCPDLDNDQDGFPDDEDRCPSAPAGQFSEDGC